MKRTVFKLAVTQMFGQTFTTMILATTALVGTALATDKALATVPHALNWVAVALCAIPAAHIMKRYGRRCGFTLGAVTGAAGAVISAYGIVENSIVLFAVGMIVIGAFNATNQQYRFAAAEVADAAYRPRAISYVVAGGVLAAFLGPELAKWTKDLMAPMEFAGTYFALAALPVVMIAVLAFTSLPRPVQTGTRRGGRPLSEIARQPKFVVAALAGMIGWGVMSLVMTTTPLAMVSCGLDFADAAFVVQWHILGMYAPSFFTGALIGRFGLPRIMLAGALMQFGCVAAALAGLDVWNFWLANVLVGMGWNFLFVGGTALVTETHTTEERATVQGFNDFLVFGTVATTSFASGWLQNSFGWDVVQYSVLPLILVAIAAAVWLLRMRSAAPQPAE